MKIIGFYNEERVVFELIQRCQVLAEDKKRPGFPGLFSSYSLDQNLRIPAGLKYQPVASNISVNSNNASGLLTGTGTIGLAD